MRNLIAAFGILLLASCLPWEDDGLYACDPDTGADCEKCDPATGWCRDITAQVAGATWLSAISGAGPGAIWAVGSDGVIVHWNGDHWEPQASGFQGGINGVWAATSGDVFVTGNAAGWGYYNGSSWVAWTQGGTQEWPSGSGTNYTLTDMLGVGGRSSVITWMLGLGGEVTYLIDDAGSVWRPGAAINANVYWNLYGIASSTCPGGSGPEAVPMWSAWTDAAGFSYLVGNCGTLIQDDFNSDADLADTVRIPTGTSEHLQAIFNVPGTSKAWIVGSGGTILYMDATNPAAVTITPRPAGTAELLWGVCGTGENDIWVAGANQTLLHWTGSWETVVQPYPETIYSLYCTTSDVWAVTETGAILRYRR